MSEGQEDRIARPPLMGRQERAVYTDAQLPLYRGNILIEALPPIWTKAEAAQKLTQEAAYDESERQLAAHVRKQITRTARRFFLDWQKGLDNLSGDL